MPTPLGLSRGTPNTILSSATTVGAGSAFAVPEKPRGGQFSNYTWQTVITGAPTAVSIVLQGSNDGVNFFTIDTSTAIGGEGRFVANTPVAFVQVNVATLTGGTAPTVTVNLVLGE